MRKIKEVLRLAEFDELSVRQIAGATTMKRSTVRDYLLRARMAGLRWTEAKEMDDESIEKLLFASGRDASTSKAVPDWSVVHTERKRPHVTLQLLWEEYRAEHPGGYGYTQYCELYRRYAETLDVSMRQTHKAGEKLFVDYSGTTMPVTDAKTGEIREAEIFVAVLGASNYAYAEATWTQSLPDWIGSHVRTAEFLGGMALAVVPDNLKSGVTKASYYEPEINPTYQRWAEHYGVAVLPARVRHPKDKPNVEAGVLLVQRWILARLRHRKFFSLAELNEAIAALLPSLNTRPFRKMDGSRASLFETLDKPALRPLPEEPYEYDEWMKSMLGRDYHVRFDDHCYSVPHELIRKTVAVRATSGTIEVFHRGARVAVHLRSNVKYGRTTIPAHMPPAHRWHAEWTLERVRAWGRNAGPDIALFFDAVMRTKSHAEQGFRVCLGVMRLEKKVGLDRLCAACRRALAIGGISLECVRTILERGQERAPLPSEATPPRAIRHRNIRGASYYHDAQRGERHAAASHD
jgi:transposase